MMRATRALREQVRIEREVGAESPDLSGCDYFRGKGSCSVGGCWTEPRCQTDMPLDGWPSRRRRGPRRRTPVRVARHARQVTR